MHEPWHAVLARSLDLEVGGGLSCCRSLRPDAGIAGHERAAGQARPATPDRCIETIGAARVDAVIRALFSLDDRHDARLAGVIGRAMPDEPPGRQHPL